MIPNALNTILGLVLVYASILMPHWIGHHYLPLLGFAVVMFALALWARASDVRRWFSNVNLALAVLLAILSLLPLPTLPSITFWGSFWVGCLVAVVAFWAALFRRELAAEAAAGR